MIPFEEIPESPISLTKDPGVYLDAEDMAGIIPVYLPGIPEKSGISNKNMGQKDNSISGTLMLSVDAVEPALRKMPPELQRQVLKYIESLVVSSEKEEADAMKFTWAGSCSDLKDTISSVQLQKKILDWWN